MAPRPAEWGIASRRRRQACLYDALAGPALRWRGWATLIERARRRWSDGAIDRALPWGAGSSLELPQVPSVALSTAPKSPTARWSSTSARAKVFRRIEAGINPELEVLRFLDRHGFSQHRADRRLVLVSGRAARRQPRPDAAYLAESTDGWPLASKARAGAGPTSCLDPGSATSGVATGHARAARERPEDPRSRPSTPPTSRSRCSTRNDRRADRAPLPPLPPLVPELEPIAGRAEELRDRLALLSHTARGPADPLPRRLSSRPEHL